MARAIDADRLADGLKLHRQPTDQKHEADRQWAVGYNAGLDRALHSIAYAPTLTQPNEPLTLEELREMDGHPVWVKQLKGLSVCDTDWAVVEFRLEPDVKHDKIRVWWPGSEDEDTPSEDDYGKTWLAYRRPPEGEEEKP